LALGTSYLLQPHGIQLDLGTKVDVEKQTSVFSLVSFQTSQLPRYEITFQRHNINVLYAH